MISQIAEFTRLARREFDRSAAAVGVTRAQWMVLSRLSRLGDGLRQVDLAEGLDVEPITLCRMIDRLEDAGLVERRRDEQDRRAWRIHLTPKALPIIEELRALGDDLHGQALAGISPEECEQFLGLLARLRNNIEKRSATARKAS